MNVYMVETVALVVIAVAELARTILLVFVYLIDKRELTDDAVTREWMPRSKKRKSKSPLDKAGEWLDGRRK